VLATETEFRKAPFIKSQLSWQMKTRIAGSRTGGRQIFQFCRGRMENKSHPCDQHLGGGDGTIGHRMHALQRRSEESEFRRVKPGRPSGPYDFYPEIEWRDDLELGATELYFAVESCGTNCPINLHPASYYLQQAATWANAYITGPNDANDTLNLYDVSGLAHFELYRALALAGNPSGLATTQSALVADLAKQLNNAIAQSAKDPFGFGFPWNTYDTTSHGGGLAIMAAEYSYLNGPR
jgi:hypothetical protein